MSQPYYNEGSYVGQVVKQVLTEAKTGTPQFLLRVKILGTPNVDGTYTAERNQYERSIYMPLTEKTVEWVVPKLQLLGFTGTSVAQLDEGHPNFQSFIGNTVDLWCSHQDDGKGGIGEKWSISDSGGGAAVTPLEPKKLRQLDALFGAAFKSNRQELPKAKAAPLDYDLSQIITDDDIPF